MQRQKEEDLCSSKVKRNSPSRTHLEGISIRKPSREETGRGDPIRYLPSVEREILFLLRRLISDLRDLVPYQKYPRRTSHDKNKLTYPPVLPPTSVEG